MTECAFIETGFFADSIAAVSAILDQVAELITQLPASPRHCPTHLTLRLALRQPTSVAHLSLGGQFIAAHCSMIGRLHRLHRPKCTAGGINPRTSRLHTCRTLQPNRRAKSTSIDTLETHEFKKDNRTGYSIGLSYPPDWGERTISLRRGDKTLIEKNMTFHFMPALWLDDGGLEITESIVITENGYECLATVPQKLLIK